MLYHFQGSKEFPFCLFFRSLSIDAYTQQQMEISKKSNIVPNTTRNSELEEYAKRYEAIGKRRGCSTSIRHQNQQQKTIWQRHSTSSNPGTVLPEEHNFGRESVTSNSSNETLRYHEDNSSFDSNETLIQPPLEFESEYKDLKRFPLQTYPSNSSMPGVGPQYQDPNMTPDNSFSYLDPDKRLRVSDNTLKLIQKQALLDYYQRHSTTNNKVNNNNHNKNSSELAADSGFYSPTESAGPPSGSSASVVIDGLDHPEQSATADSNGLEVS